MGDERGRSGATRITTAAEETQDLPGSWSSDGSHILVERHYSRTTGHSELYLASADGSGLTLLRTSDPFTNEVSPQFSPAGDRIVYAVEMWSPCCNTELAAVNADGTEPVRLTDSATYEYGPVWTKGGTHIVFTENLFFGLMIMNADGTGRLKILDGLAEHPTLAP